MHILIVEDDLLLGRGLQNAITRWGYTSEWAKDGASALAAVRTFPFDMVLLDLGLPIVNGLDVLAAMRREHRAVPTLILTARDALSDRISGLDAGGDDYLVKPFELEELAARIRALQRRTSKVDLTQLCVGRLSIDALNQNATFDGQPLTLSRQEFLLLKTLAERAGRVVARDVLERILYGNAGVESNALEVHVHSLRRKTDARLIRTARGVGYYLTETP